MKSESARGSDPPEMGGIFKSDSGFATLDLSTGKCLFSVKLVRRAEPMEKAWGFVPYGSAFTLSYCSLWYCTFPAT